MNLKNKRLYDEYLIEATKDGSKEPDATALAKLIETNILNKTYKIKGKDKIETFDIIVYFVIDPIFGMYFEDDGDGEEVVATSTPNGVILSYV